MKIGNPEIFLTTLSTPLKKFPQNSEDTSPWISKRCASMNLKIKSRFKDA
jgi:hypothetical protein